MPKSAEIYVLKITLIDSSPEIWRRIEVPMDFSFYDLHDAIQHVMPWEGSHLHEFLIKDKTDKSRKRATRRIGEPDLDNDSGVEVESEDDVFLKDCLPHAKKVVYTYDFGDCWDHEIKLENVIQAEAKVKYPRCTGGQLACPPEDCGGISGYYNSLDTLKGDDCETKTELLEWFGSFDPESFDYTKVKF
jgi:hypothetical protein